MNCTICAAPLNGRQQKYCSKTCAIRAASSAQTASGWRRKYNQRDTVKARQRERLATVRYEQTFTCERCGNEHTNRRGEQVRFCSRACAQPLRGQSCDVPSDHPARWFGEHEPLTYGSCGWCEQLVIGHADWLKAYCSQRCKRRAKEVRRRGREAGDSCAWSWADFMRIAARFQFCCAYCGHKPADGEQLDPDHVVPLSRGGWNSTTNLLPACRSCNSSKGALLLHEWAERRHGRGLAPRMTAWAPEDRRFQHLTQVRLLTA